MHDHDEKQLNSQDAELAQLRSLVGDARDDDFSLDDILAEYSQRSRPKSVVALDEDEDLLVFPTSNRPPDPELFGQEADEDPADELDEEDFDDEEGSLDYSGGMQL